MIPFTPYQHQIKELQEASKMPHRGLLWEMGTGKTPETVFILRQLYINANKLKKTLILCPSGVVFNWRKEILNFSKIGISSIFVSSGSGVKRSNDLINFLFHKENLSFCKEAIVIINYEGLRNDSIFNALKEWEPKILVCDESHLLKNPKAIASERVFEIALKTDNRYILSGTPILNNEMDLFMQMKILDFGSTFGSNFFIFRGKWFTDINTAWRNSGNATKVYPKWVFNKDKEKEFSDLLYKSCSRVLLDSVVDLPERIYQTVYVEMSPQQSKAYKEMKRDFITFVESSKKEGKLEAIVASLAVTKALRLQQICCGILKTENGEEILMKDLPRLMALKEILEQITPNHKIIIWCSFTANYTQLGDLCTKLNIGHVFITGEQDVMEKQVSIDSFEEDDKIRICIANRKAGGTGTNLTAASYYVNYSKDFSLGNDLQSKARNRRIGSDRHSSLVGIDLVSRNTIDEVINQALAKKLDISKRILDIIKDI